MLKSLLEWRRGMSGWSHLLVDRQAQADDVAPRRRPQWDGAGGADGWE
jgi:hypothetical protein